MAKTKTKRSNNNQKQNVSGLLVAKQNVSGLKMANTKSKRHKNGQNKN